jgi:hypothetical protein
LEKNLNEINAIQFDNSGNQLSTFSSEEQSIKVYAIKMNSQYLSNYENLLVKQTHAFFVDNHHECTLSWDEDDLFVYLSWEEDSIAFSLE